MANEPNIAELAVAAWRLERWLDNLVAERKMAAKSSLRSIKKFLDASGVEIVDPVGWKFDPGLPIEVINNEAPDVDESRLIVIETNAPIIKKDDIPIQFGRVILGVDIKEQKANSELKKEEPSQNVISQTPENTASQKLPYHVTKIELYEEHEGYAYWIAVKMGLHALNNSLKVFLMDKFTYKDFRNGSKVQPADGYVQKKEVDYLRVPYQGEWYVVVMNDSYDWKPEYEVEIEHGWVKSPPVEKSDDSNPQNTENEKGEEQAVPRKDVNEGSVENENCVVDETEKSEESAVTQSKNQDVVISEKMADKLARKNKTSYYTEIARMTGALKQPHGSGKKKKKHR